MTPPPRQRFSRLAGVAIPLFSLRGAHDCGSGEILDLIPFIDWLGRGHQRVIQLLPINETAPREASPYNTLSAFAIDPTYISTAQLIDVRRSDTARRWLASAAVQRRLRRLRGSPLRHRRLAYALKLRLLDLGYERFRTQTPASPRGRRFERFCQSQTWWLDDYALFRALKEQFAWTSWETWPAELRGRQHGALQQAADTLQPRLRFFRYVQWVAAEQWARTRAHAHARGVLLKGDLPFVCGRDSADVWAHQELFDMSSSAGAPPDAFSPTGQAWGLPLYDWAALRRTDYAWWRQRVRQARTLYDVFRIDHVVGLYRTYAIPVRDGGTAGFVPRAEAEQLAQGAALMGAILDEAGGAQVVAEDLGTVPDWVRTGLTALEIPGYKVFRWEQRHGAYLDPRSYPPLSVATTGTHDTDTLVEWWNALTAAERAAAAQVFALNHAGLSTQDYSGLPWTPNLHLALLRRLYEAGSVLTILPIQDLFGWRERINTPATVDRHNWTYRLPGAVRALGDTPAVRQRMEAIRRMIDETARYAPPAAELD